MNRYDVDRLMIQLVEVNKQLSRIADALERMVPEPDIIDADASLGDPPWQMKHPFREGGSAWGASGDES